MTLIAALLSGCTAQGPTLRYAPQSPLAPLAPTGSESDDTETSGTDGTDGTSSTDSTPGTDGTSGTGSWTTTTPTSTTPTGGTTPTAIEACYPGPNRAYDVCFEAVSVSPLPPEYLYPAPPGGDPQYEPPVRFLDLSLLDPSTSLAPNFILDEVAQEWKGQWAVVQVHAIERLQDLRDQLGAIVVNSGYRSPDYNASIGGATWSRHMYGDAFDLDPLGATLSQLGDSCAATGAGYVELYETHVHCDWRDDALDPAFYPVALRQPAGRPQLPPAQSATLELDLASGRWSAPSGGWEEGEPLRQWTALDADGRELATATGRTFLPPADAAEVEVVIGGRLTLREAR